MARSWSAGNGMVRGGSPDTSSLFYERRWRRSRETTNRVRCHSTLIRVHDQSLSAYLTPLKIEWTLFRRSSPSKAIKYKDSTADKGIPANPTWSTRWNDAPPSYLFPWDRFVPLLLSIRPTEPARNPQISLNCVVRLRWGFAGKKNNIHSF